MTDAIDTLARLEASSEDYKILYQDDIVLVVNKPAKLLTVPGRHPDNADCLISRLQREFLSASIVHRLDYDTSGLLIIPLTKRALSDISKQFQVRTVVKQYIAVVDGIIKADSQRIDLPLAADLENRPCYKVCQQSGKPSVTDMKVISRDLQLQQTRVQLNPITGRSHQLRVHMQALGHTILGDSLYATKAIAEASPRLLLHAEQIQFTHPLTGKSLNISAAPNF
ncbi:RluA family pseudouridine synthase [Rheinheimera sp. MMS21-TC3]|uniref:RluA family pseudouridine synthase n=1 Tax=Rheinheimera sp. MMS21-TC3 TaxID=3072790 RepID=UPI0028C3C6A3|nr:pseudouridine synthase [Rheinheimera sp. MMS21-TC3]WNO60742.1 pseudouridine synthase [Rheinheimera sp. MMS21-TC3]